MIEQLPLLFDQPKQKQPSISRSALLYALQEKHVFAFYSKQRAQKDAFVKLLQEQHPDKTFIYLCPKVIASAIRSLFPSMVVVPIEQFTQRDSFLRLHDLVNHDTVLIMENISRYTLLSSDKFNCLHRLRMATTYRYLIDIVPFTQKICKLYLPYSYLDREILRYSNGYAFEYNYLEEDENGNTRQAHDYDFLAEKITNWCYTDYTNFLPGITYLNSVLSQEEEQRYQARKIELFELYDNPRKIVTELCDCANMMESRYEQLAGLLDSLSGQVVLYTNIVKNNPLIKAHLRRRGVKKSIEYKTYTTHTNQPIDADHVILFETPINQNRVSMLDVLSDISPDARVWYFRNNAKADTFVFDEVQAEWQAIDKFTRELWSVQHAKVS